MATAVGLLASGLGLFGQLSDFLSPNAKPQQANVRISIGNFRPGDQSRSLGGDTPGIELFDGIGSYVGFDIGQTSSVTGGGHVDAGTSHTYSISTRLQPEFISVVAGGANGVCIHTVAVNANGLNFVWTGDVGKQCGAEWYPQSNPVDNVGNRPACIWIDTNGDDGHIWKGFNIHLLSFSAPADVQAKRTAEWNQTQDLMCKSEPRFSLYKDIEIGRQVRVFDGPYTPTADGLDNHTQILDASTWRLSEKPTTPLDGDCAKQGDTCPPLGPSAAEDLKVKDPSRRKRRSVIKRQAWMAEQLIISNIASHSANELCQSGTSNGPDFVSMPEGLFCDMSEKQLWPLCSDATITNCFDMTSQTVKGSDGSESSSIEAPYSNSTGSVQGNSKVVTTAVPDKSYKSTQTWS